MDQLPPASNRFYFRIVLTITIAFHINTTMNLHWATWLKNKILDFFISNLVSIEFLLIAFLTKK